MFGTFSDTGYIFVLVAPLLPAVIAGIVIGLALRDDESRSRLSFSPLGAVTTYVFLVVIANIVRERFTPAPEAFDLTLQLQGPQAAIDQFLEDTADLRVSFQSRENSGEALFFTNFTVDGSRAKLQSHIASSLPVRSDRFANAVLFPKQTKTSALGLMPPDLKLARQMEAVLTVESVNKDSAQNASQQ
jgi:hypothetical protein